MFSANCKCYAVTQGSLDPSQIDSSSCLAHDQSVTQDISGTSHLNQGPFSGFDVLNYDSTVYGGPADTTTNFYGSTNPMVDSCLELSSQASTSASPNCQGYGPPSGTPYPYRNSIGSTASYPMPTPLPYDINNPYPQDFTSYHRADANYENTTHLFPSEASPPLYTAPYTTPRNSQKSKLRSRPKPKILPCPSCSLLFARTADLKRHINGVHLHIRHHCQVSGCRNNGARGYCRLEKLRNHMTETHGTF